MVTQQNKKLTLGILLTFIICIGSAILAAYSTGPYGNYPNPGIHPGMIGPGTFNDSGVANPQWEIPGKLNIDKNATVKGTLNIDKGLIIGNPAGGDKGTGTINVESVYVNGSKLQYESTNQIHFAKESSSVTSTWLASDTWRVIEQFNISLPAGSIVNSIILQAEVNPDKDGIEAKLRIHCLDFPSAFIETDTLIRFSTGYNGHPNAWDERVGVYIPKNNYGGQLTCTAFMRPSGGKITIDVLAKEITSDCLGCNNGIRNPVLIVTYVII